MSEERSTNRFPNEPARGQSGALEGPRPPRLDERDELIDMINFIFRTDKGRAPTIGRDWPHVYTPDNLANVSVMRDPAAGKLVASTGVWANDVVLGDVQVRVGGINTVGTLPDYRLRGLGSQVMLAAHQTMRDLGCLVGLLGTGIADWYRRLGWEEAGMVRAYRLERGTIGALPQLAAGEQVRAVPWPGETGDADTARLLADLLRLYDQERLGGRRTPALLAELLTARLVDQIVLAEADGAPRAYLFLQENGIVEWAGPASSVAGLARACFEMSAAQDDAPSLSLVAPGWAHPLAALLDNAGVPFSERYLGMLYLVDPQAVLDAYGVTAVQLEAEGDAFVLHRAEEGSARRVTLDRRQLTRLFFGPEPDSEATELFPDIFPLPFWQWYVEKV